MPDPRIKSRRGFAAGGDGVWVCNLFYKGFQSDPSTTTTQASQLRICILSTSVKAQRSCDICHRRCDAGEPQARPEGSQSLYAVVSSQSRSNFESSVVEDSGLHTPPRTTRSCEDHRKGTAPVDPRRPRHCHLPASFRYLRFQPFPHCVALQRVDQKFVPTSKILLAKVVE
jgi:hypothetical protein